MKDATLWVVMQNDAIVAIFDGRERAQEWATEKLLACGAPVIHIEGPFAVNAGGHVCQALPSQIGSQTKVY